MHEKTRDVHYYSTIITNFIGLEPYFIGSIHVGLVRKSELGRAVFVLWTTSCQAALLNHWVWIAEAALGRFEPACGRWVTRLEAASTLSNRTARNNFQLSAISFQNDDMIVDHW
jgi:hypothetical protein